MDYVVTLVSSCPDKPLDEGHVEVVTAYLRGAVGVPVWLSSGKAVDIGVSALLGYEDMRALRALLVEAKVDVFCMAAQGRAKKLALFDMDSTIVNAETLDEMAARAGVGAEVAEITHRAMVDGADFTDSLRARLAMLKGVVADDLLGPVFAEMVFNPGAKVLIDGLRARGVPCVLVSGGFTFFTEKVAGALGFSGHHGNVLEIDDGGLLTGWIVGSVVDGGRKAALLEHYAREYDLALADCFAMGDGSNDLPMMRLAGLGIGYKPAAGGKVEQEMRNIIVHGDLSSALYAQGASSS